MISNVTVINALAKAFESFVGYHKVLNLGSGQGYTLDIRDMKYKMNTLQ